MRTRAGGHAHDHGRWGAGGRDPRDRRSPLAPARAATSRARRSSGSRSRTCAHGPRTWGRCAPRPGARPSRRSRARTGVGGARSGDEVHDHLVHGPEVRGVEEREEARRPGGAEAADPTRHRESLRQALPRASEDLAADAVDPCDSVARAPGTPRRGSLPTPTCSPPCAANSGPREFQPRLPGRRLPRNSASSSPCSVPPRDGCEGRA